MTPLCMGWYWPQSGTPWTPGRSWSRTRRFRKFGTLASPCDLNQYENLFLGTFESLANDVLDLLLDLDESAVLEFFLFLIKILKNPWTTTGSLARIASTEGGSSARRCWLDGCISYPNSGEKKAHSTSSSTPPWTNKRCSSGPLEPTP